MRHLFPIASGVAVVLLLALLLVANAPALPLPRSGTAVAGTPPSPGGGPPEGTAYPTPIRHVITVVLENQNPTTVLQQGPFERYLAAHYAFVRHDYAVCHPSSPNYLSLTSGAPWQCGSDNYNVYSTSNVADVVEKAGLSWAAYAESMPSACDTSDSGSYAVRHVPFLYYADIVHNATRCDSHIVNFTAWSSAVSAGSVPSYAFIAPNKLDDGHDTNVSYSDAWLKGWLSPLLNDSFFNSSVFFIVYDESAGSSYTSGYDGLTGGPVYLSAVSPWVRHNFTLSMNASHYNLLETTEWLLGLGNTGHNDSNSSFPAMQAMFVNSTTGSSRYALTGVVSAAASGAPVAGASVSISGGPTVGTNSTGAYSFLLPNGTYAVGISAPGFLASSATVSISGASVDHNFSLVASTRAEFPVSGRVTTALGSAPVAGATVGLGGIGSTLTAADGTYRLLAPNGTYPLTVQAPGYVAASTEIVVDGVPVVHNFSLSPPIYAVHGTVTDLTEEVPIPLANVSIVATGLAELTGPNGSYQFGVPNGSYRIHVARPGYVPQTVPVTVAGASVRCDVALALAHFPLAGRVVTRANGSAVSGANVSLSGGAWQITNASGAFTFQVPNGTYMVRVTDAGYETLEQNVTVDGRPIVEVFNVSSNGTTGPPSSPSPPPSDWIRGPFGWLLVAAVPAIATGGAAAILWRRRNHR